MWCRPPNIAPQAPDRALVDRAVAEHRIVVTEDRDFGEIVFAEGRPTSGIVFLRIRPRLWGSKWPKLRDAIATHREILYVRYTVIEEARTRSQALSVR